jgi:Cu/Ag efflux protein CusF
MKTLILILVVSVTILSIACGNSVVNTNVSTEVTPPSILSTPYSSPAIPTDGNYSGKGKVTKINIKLGSIEIDHDEIFGLMPPMKMEFKVKDKAMLSELKIGDEVDFVIEYKHPTETIMEIKKNQ